MKILTLLILASLIGCTPYVEIGTPQVSEYPGDRDFSVPMEAKP